MTSHSDNLPKGIANAFVATLIGSTAAAATKHIADAVPVSMIVFFQFLICVGVMLPWLARQTKQSISTQRPWTHLVRGLGGCVSFYAFYWSLGNVALVDATLLRNTSPLFVPLVTWVWLSVVVPRSRWVPLVVGFIGVMIILQPGIVELKIGHIWGLFSGLTLAISMVGTRTLSSTEPSLRINFYYFSIALLCSVPFAVSNWQWPPLWTLPYLGYIGVSIFIAMYCYTQSFRFAKASVVSPIGYFAVVNAGLLGWLIWGHVPSLSAFVGIAVVVAAGTLTVYLANREGSEAKKPPVLAASHSQ